MAKWWSIEVFHGEFSAENWRDAYRETLTESAVTNGALDWAWHSHRWGVVFEASFPDDAAWERVRALPVVQAALDGQVLDITGTEPETAPVAG